MTATTTDTLAVANRLVELMREGKNREAIEELYADDAVVVEAMDGGPHGRIIEGKQKILGASDQFFQMMEVHGGEVHEPFPNDNRFICHMTLDATPKQGPMTGQRFEMKEMALYTVANGKITRSEFFYHFAGDSGC